MIRKLLLSATVMVVAVACTIENTQNQGTGKEAEVDGELIFKRSCENCHGRKGADPSDPTIAKLSASTLSKEEVINVITNGRENMAPFKNVLSGKEIEAVGDYIITLRE